MPNRHCCGLLAAFWVLGAAAMVLWTQSGGPYEAKAPLEHGLEERLT